MDDLHNGEDADDDEVVQSDQTKICFTVLVTLNLSQVLDLSGRDLEKLSRATDKDQLNTTTLILDDNKLQRLDYLHSYECLEKVGDKKHVVQFSTRAISLTWFKLSFQFCYCGCSQVYCLITYFFDTCAR